MQPGDSDETEYDVDAEVAGPTRAPSQLVIIDTDHFAPPEGLSLDYEPFL